MDLIGLGLGFNEKKIQFQNSYFHFYEEKKSKFTLEEKISMKKIISMKCAGLGIRHKPKYS